MNKECVYNRRKRLFLSEWKGRFSVIIFEKNQIKNNHNLNKFIHFIKNEFVYGFIIFQGIQLTINRNLCFNHLCNYILAIVIIYKWTLNNRTAKLADSTYKLSFYSYNWYLSCFTVDYLMNCNWFLGVQYKWSSTIREKYVCM